MKIFSWNVNGIRANNNKGIFDIVLKKNFDIICFQETKAHPDQLIEKLKSPSGYYSFFNSSQLRKGYSGVCIFSKIKPLKVEYNFSIKNQDLEGRILILHFKNFILVNCYFPNGGGGDLRFQYKLDFFKKFISFIKREKKRGCSIILCGDVNIAHQEIDLKRPKENSKDVGFLPIEREQINQFLKEGLIDVFRYFYPNKKDAYSWWDYKTRARERNVGWRIDYFFASQEIISYFKKIEIQDKFLGSDHCPILTEINLK